MHRFYAPDFPRDGEFALPVDEGRHLARVLRMKPGDTIAVFDGRGREAVARVRSISSRRVYVSVVGTRTAAAEPVLPITLGQALLKSDKMDGVIRDAVMLGATAIQPFLTRRTDVPKAAVKTGVRHERWERTAIASAKQCGRAVVPPVLETVELEQLLTSDRGALRLMFVEPGGGETAAVRELRTLEAEHPQAVVVLIGPEGGWERGEIDAAAAAGVTLVTFGPRVLRADAAGAAALALLRYIWD